MERYGRTLAATHQLTPRRTRDQLLPRLAANEAVLIDVCKRLTAAVSANHRISPAGEWLLDNFHLIEEQIGTAKRHLPRGYSRELPRLAIGPSAGLPRVYDIALETISHGDGRVDADGLETVRGRVPDRYRLKLGRALGHPDHAAPRADREPSARRCPRRRRQGRARSGQHLGRPHDGDRGAGPEEPHPRDRRHGAIESSDRERIRGGTRAPAAGAKRGAGARIDMDRTAPRRVAPDDRAVRAIGESAAGIGPGLDQQQHRKPAVPRARSTGASSSSRLSDVERILRQDPAGVYGAMDSRRATAIGTRSSASPGRVAFRKPRSPRRRSNWRAAGAAANDGDHRAAHVGFYLIDDGLAELERAATVRVSAMGNLRRIGNRIRLDHLSRCDRACRGHRRRRVSSRTPMPRERVRTTLALVVVLVAARGQPAGDKRRQLAGYAGGDASPAAANGFLQGHRRQGTHAGGGSDDARQRRKGRRPGRRRSKFASSPIATRTFTSRC